MITREQVADLREGDVVEFRQDSWEPDAWLRGRVFKPAFDTRFLALPVPGEGTACYLLRGSTGDPTDPDGTLTVVSRAPRPLYVNHPRTEPVPGDVVRAADGEGPETYHYVSPDFGAPWGITTGPKRFPREHLPARLRLLVDGETGQVVP